ncbi:hypothetical protein C8N33_10916 [Pararhodobacter aggregans]|nr:hypothetical protein C8N33_10916 [Pararhodobacter aggregans]
MARKRVIPGGIGADGENFARLRRPGASCSAIGTAGRCWRRGATDPADGDGPAEGRPCSDRAGRQSLRLARGLAGSNAQQVVKVRRIIGDPGHDIATLDEARAIPDLQAGIGSPPVRPCPRGSRGQGGFPPPWIPRGYLQNKDGRRSGYRKRAALTDGDWGRLGRQARHGAQTRDVPLARRASRPRGRDWRGADRRLRGHVPRAPARDLFAPV